MLHLPKSQGFYKSKVGGNSIVKRRSGINAISMNSLNLAQIRRTTMNHRANVAEHETIATTERYITITGTRGHKNNQ